MAYVELGEAVSEAKSLMDGTVYGWKMAIAEAERINDAAKRIKNDHT